MAEININAAPRPVTKLNIDDWHFRFVDHDVLPVEVFLNNGQHALLEAHPMKNPSVTNGLIPELIVFCEVPGEKLSETGASARWVARSPDRNCPGSNVDLPPALLQQIQERLAALTLPRVIDPAA